MNPNEIGKIGKLTQQSQEITKKRNLKSKVSFEDVFKEELVEAKKEAKSVTNISPPKQLLNIKNVKTEEIFIQKAFEHYHLFLKSLDSFRNILSSRDFDIKEAKSIIENMSEIVRKLKLLSDSIENREIKEDLNRAILIGNVEIEKYIRGEYF